MTLLETVSDGRWTPGIGDASWAGWLILAAYAVAACLAALAYRSCRSESLRLERTSPRDARNERLLAAFWLLASIIVMALGINKQLDLQSLFTQELRDVARLQGWYNERRQYQFAFVVAIAGTSLLGIGTMAWALRGVLRKAWMAMLGLGGLTTFVVIRAASFHHVDTFLRRLTHAGNVALEFSAIAIIAAGAWRARRSRSGDCRARAGRERAATVTVPARDPSASDGTP